MKELEIEFLPPEQPVEVSEEEIAFELAKCCLKLGDIENAKKYAQNALEIYPDFQDALNIIKKLEKNND